VLKLLNESSDINDLIPFVMDPSAQTAVATWLATEEVNGDYCLHNPSYAAMSKSLASLPMPMEADDSLNYG
jgi:hypothetical protein